MPLAETDLRDVVRWGVSLTRSMTNRSAKITIDLADDLPLILGRRGELAQVVTNLILNAAQAMEGADRVGTILLRCRFIDEMVVLEVTDDGPGMTPAVRARVFEPFYTTKPGRGTGLGLSIVSDIVAAHHGELSIDSVVGRGTTVQIRFEPRTAGATPAPLPNAQPTHEILVIAPPDQREAVESVLHGERLTSIQHSQIERVLTDIQRYAGIVVVSGTPSEDALVFGLLASEASDVLPRVIRCAAEHDDAKGWGEATTLVGPPSRAALRAALAMLDAS